MIRTLFIIAGSAFLLCLISFVGAAALGGADIKRDGWHFTVNEEDGSLEWSGDGAAGALSPEDAVETTRTIPWGGGDRLIVDAPGEIDFVEGSEATVRVTGPKSVVDRVRLVDGRLSVQDVVQRETSTNLEAGPLRVRGSNKSYWPSDGLRIVVTAPDVRRFELNSSANLEIRDYDQASLALAVSGSGEVKATGRTQALELDISGSGDVDLSDLTTTNADVDVSGSGNASVAPTGEATIALSGSGDVDLVGRPTKVTSSSTGSGDIRQD